MSNTVQEKEIKLFNYFIDKAYKLETSPFWAWVKKPMKEYNIDEIKSGNWLAHEGLKEEELDSFCLTLRLLIQDKDGFSIRCIKNITNTMPNIYEPHLSEILNECEILKRELSENSFTSLNSERSTSNQELFNIIFYGGLVHLNEQRRDKFESIVDSGVFSFFVFHSFIKVLFIYRNAISGIAFHLVQILNVYDDNQIAIYKPD